MVEFPDKTITAQLNRQIALYLYLQSINFKFKKKGEVSSLVTLGPWAPSRLDPFIEKCIGPFTWYNVKYFVKKKDRIVIMFNEVEYLALFQGKGLGIWWLLC